MFVCTGIPGCVMARNPLHLGIFSSSGDCTWLQAMNGSERSSIIQQRSSMQVERNWRSQVNQELTTSPAKSGGPGILPPTSR